MSENSFLFLSKLEQRNMKYVMNSPPRRQGEFVNLLVYFIENLERLKLLSFKLSIALRSNVLASQSNVIVNSIFHKLHTSVSVFLLFSLSVTQDLLKHLDEFAEVYSMLFD